MNMDHGRFLVETKGQEVIATTYWSTPQARAGSMYVSFEAGAVRVLVPDAARHLLDELRPVGTPVTLELAQWQGQNMWRVSLLNGYGDPYVLDIDRGEADYSLMEAYAGWIAALMQGTGAASRRALDGEDEGVIEARRETVELFAGESDA